MSAVWQSYSAALSRRRDRWLNTRTAAGTSDALLSRMIPFEILIWLALGMVVGLCVTYFNLWRGKIWQVTLLGALGGLIGGALFKLLPGASIDDFDALGSIGALIVATVLVVVVGRRTGRALPMS